MPRDKVMRTPAELGTQSSSAVWSSPRGRTPAQEAKRAIPITQPGPSIETAMTMKKASTTPTSERFSSRSQSPPFNKMASIALSEPNTSTMEKKATPKPNEKFTSRNGVPTPKAASMSENGAIIGNFENAPPLINNAPTIGGRIVNGVGTAANATENVAAADRFQVVKNPEEILGSSKDKEMFREVSCVDGQSQSYT